MSKRWKPAAFWALTLLMTATVVGGAGWVGRRLWRQQGKGLNVRAWEASFLERNLDVPPDGPREGYWGARLPPHTKHSRFGWHMAEVHHPPLVDVDERGLQRVPGPRDARRVVILGGSVATGANASRADRTYFHRLAQLAAQDGVPVDITVFAAGAWKSVQEEEALRHFLHVEKPDVVLVLNGLNDVLNGATARAVRRGNAYPRRTRLDRHLPRPRLRRARAPLRRAHARHGPHDVGARGEAGGGVATGVVREDAAQ
ncbi:MAG: SGNH/GDSL hydrolase family protein [Myxococcota bacterium]